MIKTGILGGETMAAGELIRILINHPDVDLRSVASETEAGRRVDRVHRGLIGDLDLIFEDKLNPEGLDVVILCGEPWMARRWMQTNDKACADENLRIIDLTGAYRDLLGVGEGSAPMVYGFPEYNRKALVRGARCTSLPSPMAMAVEAALFPLAKNMLLEGDVKAPVMIAATENFENRPASQMTDTEPMAVAELSTRLDPIAPMENRPDGEATAAEVKNVMKEIQPSWNGNVQLTVSRDSKWPRGILAEVEVPCCTSLSELRRLYDEAYCDHSFTFSVDLKPTVLDVANTNKCLMSLAYPDSAHSLESMPVLKITVAIDNLMKGAAGNAVHCLNLLFGLQECTGLALKASAF